MKIREGIPLTIQRKKLMKKFKKAEKRFKTAGPIRQERLIKEADSVSKKLEFINKILGYNYEEENKTKKL